MGKLKILVVDDEPGICSGIKRILSNFTVTYPFMEENIEFEIDDVLTGEEAVDIITTKPPDILLLDNKLPGISGVEILEKITKEHINVLVIMITSHASLDIAVKATANGAFDFVPKPFTPQELKSSVENIAKHIYLKRMTKQMKVEGKQIRFQFLSVLSHELKAPINAIEGYLKIIKTKQVGDNIDSYIPMIDRSLARINGMRNLIMDLLDLTHIEAGKKKRELKSVNITKTAQIAIDTIEPLAIQMDIKINLDANNDFIITADPEEIEIIFNNLLSNAVKYNKKGGTVDCLITEENDSIRISVSDTGIGMEQEDIPKLFKEFFRLKNEKTRSITGTGLGLSIVKDIVQLYNGNIEVKSKIDQGSTFSLTLNK
jgi:signal transduction histidine kinase